MTEQEAGKVAPQGFHQSGKRTVVELLVFVLASGLLGAMDGSPTPAGGAASVHEFSPR